MPFDFFNFPGGFFERRQYDQRHVIEPVEKALNGLADRTDKGRK